MIIAFTFLLASSLLRVMLTYTVLRKSVLILVVVSYFLKNDCHNTGGEKIACFDRNPLKKKSKNKTKNSFQITGKL